MKLKSIQRLLTGLVIVLLRCFCGASETNTVLVCNSTRIMRYTVANGTWNSQSDFATTNNIGGIASNGRRVFVGEYVYNTPGRILEYDMDGNYRRSLVTVPNSVEHMNMSKDGRWLYAAVGIWLADGAAIHRYDTVTGAGGLFIPNQGTNALGDVLWKFKIPRGLVEDDAGTLWISERNTGSVYKFDSDGVYLGKVTSLPNIQTLYYSSEDQKIYGVTTGDATYIIDPATGLATTNTIAGLGARLGITQISGTLYSSPNGFITSYDLDLLTKADIIASASGVKQILTLPIRAPETNTVLVCNSTKIMRYTVANGTWSSQSDFVTTNKIGGIASNGRRVFVGEYDYNKPGRILEYDRDGNYRRVLVTAPNHVEHMNMSQDGKWLYAAVGIWLADDAAIHRYDAVTGAGGLFIPNQGTNALGDVLWKFNVLRGLVEDDDGTLWISERNTGSVYKFDSDGAYMGKVTSLPNIQTLHYSSEDQKIYGVTTVDATYIIDPATGVTTTNTIVGLGGRRGITQLGDTLYSSPNGFITSYDLGLLTFSNVIASVSGVIQIITLPDEPSMMGTVIVIQ